MKPNASGKSPKVTLTYRISGVRGCPPRLRHETQNKSAEQSRSTPINRPRLDSSTPKNVPRAIRHQKKKPAIKTGSMKTQIKPRSNFTSPYSPAHPCSLRPPALPTCSKHAFFHDRLDLGQRLVLNLADTLL